MNFFRDLFGGEPHPNSIVGTVPILARVSGKMYLALADGHRTTFVVGMIDMFDVMARHTYPENRKGMAAAIKYAAKLESDALRKAFDAYLVVHPAPDDLAICSPFVEFLYAGGASG